MGYLTTDKRKTTINSLFSMKQRGEKIAQMTAYDFTTAQILDEAGIDSILIGDSAANVVCGYDTTLPIMLDEMIYHAKAVARGTKYAFTVCDMPFGSYQTSCEEGVRNAIRIVKETGVDAVKLEGGREVLPTVQGIINAGIPVVAHLGLTPQSINAFGSYKVRAQQIEEAEKLYEDAKMLDEVGVSMITLEKIPAHLAERITNNVKAITIGIGAGNATNGQVLVYADALGITKNFAPRFLRRFANLRNAMQTGVEDYIKSVKAKQFPNEEESY